MIEYLFDIKPLEGDLSDAEIAAHLSTRTAAPISVQAAKDALLESGVVVVDPVTGNRVGPLIDHYASLPDGQNKVLLAWFINHCLGTGQDVETNNYPRSAQFAAVEAGLPAEISPVAVVMVNEAGGRPDAGTDAAEVDVVRQQWLADEAARQAAEEAQRQAEAQYQQDLETANGYSVQAQTLWNQNIAPLQDSNAPVTDPAIWQAALQAMADGWSN
jgi:hypothetical protein